MDENNEKDSPGWTDAYWKFCKEDEKEVIKDEEINTTVSWKEVEWDTAREQVAKQVLEAETLLIQEEVKRMICLRATNIKCRTI